MLSAMRGSPLAALADAEVAELLFSSPQLPLTRQSHAAVVRYLEQDERWAAVSDAAAARAAQASLAERAALVPLRHVTHERDGDAVELPVPRFLALMNVFGDLDTTPGARQYVTATHLPATVQVRLTDAADEKPLAGLTLLELLNLITDACAVRARPCDEALRVRVSLRAEHAHACHVLATGLAQWRDVPLFVVVRADGAQLAPVAVAASWDKLSDAMVQAFMQLRKASAQCAGGRLF